MTFDADIVMEQKKRMKWGFPAGCPSAYNKKEQTNKMSKTPTPNPMDIAIVSASAGNQVKHPFPPWVPLGFHIRAYQ